jgi:uncharacterized protein (UPF0332 family)
VNWEARSNENLEAARLCRAAKLWAPAITRYYYAVYQKALEVLAAVGPGAPTTVDGNEYWPHHCVGPALCEVFPDINDVEDRYDLLRTRRVRADYSSDPVTEQTCATSGESAELLLGLMG